MGKQRYWALVDVDNCYVSCERSFRPDLNGKPCVVERKGVIYAATGLGTQLLPDSFYYDRFLLKAILYLAGREKSFARMDANKAALEEYEHQEVEKYTILNFEYGQQYGKNNKSDDAGGGIYSHKIMGVYPAVNLVFCKKILNIGDGEKNYKLFARDDEAGREEWRQSIRDKYGVEYDHNWKVPEVREHYHNTCERLYGVRHP